MIAIGISVSPVFNNTDGGVAVGSTAPIPTFDRTIFAFDSTHWTFDQDIIPSYDRSIYTFDQDTWTFDRGDS